MKRSKTARIVTNRAYDAYALPIIRKLGWPTINELMESETLKMVYKSVNDQAPFTLRKCSSGCPIQARENFTVSKQIWPFLVANLLLDRSAARTRALNCGMIFPLSQISQNVRNIQITYQQQRHQLMLILSRLLWLAVFLIFL